MISLGCDALGLGQRRHILGRRAVEADGARRIARPDRQLFHVDVGRVEQAPGFGDRQHRQRVGAGLGGDGGAFQRIERDVDLGAGALLGPDLFADIEHRRFVALALADHHGAIHRQLVQRRAHRFDRRRIGRLFIAPPDQAGGGDRRRFGHAHHLEDKNAVENIGCLNHG